MNQIEFLLRLSENAQDRGDELAQRHTAERQAHGKELVELLRMIDMARQNVHAEMQRWNMIIPTPQLPSEKINKPIGEGNASAKGFEPRDHKPEHQRAIAPRQ